MHAAGRIVPNVLLCARIYGCPAPSLSLHGLQPEKWFYGAWVNEALLKWQEDSEPFTPKFSSAQKKWFNGDPTQITYGGTAPPTTKPYNWKLIAPAIALSGAYMLLQVGTTATPCMDPVTECPHTTTTCNHIQLCLHIATCIYFLAAAHALSRADDQGGPHFICMLPALQAFVISMHFIIKRMEKQASMPGIPSLSQHSLTAARQKSVVTGFAARLANSLSEGPGAHSVHDDDDNDTAYGGGSGGSSSARTSSGFKKPSMNAGMGSKKVFPLDGQLSISTGSDDMHKDVAELKSMYGKMQHDISACMGLLQNALVAATPRGHQMQEDSGGSLNRMPGPLAQGNGPPRLLLMTPCHIPPTRIYYTLLSRQALQGSEWRSCRYIVDKRYPAIL